MKEEFETTLSGTDGQIDGIVSYAVGPDAGMSYEFNSLDRTLQIRIAKDENGHWYRIDGTEPYLSGWVDELSEKIMKKIANPDHLTF